MKAYKGDYIKLIERICYGSFDGIVEVDRGKVMKISSRTHSDDGVITIENINVFDKKYIVQ